MAYDKLVDSVFLNNIFSNIGDAIREKTRKSELIDIYNMPDEIRSIASGSGGGSYCWRVSDEKIVPSRLVPIMSANNTNGYEVLFSTSATNQQAFKAFDGNPSTMWIANRSVPQYIGIHFPFEVAITSFSIQNSAENNRAIKDFSLQGSSDGETWIDFGVYTNSSEASQKSTFTVDAPSSNTYWRIYVITTETSAYARAAIIEFYSELGTEFVVSDNPDEYPQDGFGEDSKYYLSIS